MHRFKLNLLVFAMFIAGNFVPYQILMIPVRNISIELGMYNSHLGLIIFHIAFQTGFCTFFLRNFIKELPFELIEAARADGATEWTIYRKIIIPLTIPALAALGVLEFTFIWNDYFWALILTQGDTVKPITVGLDVFERSMDNRLEFSFSRFCCCGFTTSNNVFYFTKTIYSRLNVWSS